MALQKRTYIDKVEVVQDYRAIQVRSKTEITDDGEIVGESYSRELLVPLQRNADGTDWEPTDLSGQDPYVVGIAGAVWDDAAREAYRSQWNDQVKPIDMQAM